MAEGNAMLGNLLLPPASHLLQMEDNWGRGDFFSLFFKKHNNKEAEYRENIY